MTHHPVHIHDLGSTPLPYRPVWQAMKQLTANRDAQSVDAFWFVEHQPVFTQGKNGHPEHLLAPGDIEVIAIDRGGQVTYHGPGQLIVYVMLDIRRLGLGIRSLVTHLENSLIATLADYHIASYARRDAPGVYVDGDKIASLGLRVSRACTYHGLALNVDMDLTPFDRINPCGYQNLKMTQISAHGGPRSCRQVKHDLSRHLCRELAVTCPRAWLGMPAMLTNPTGD